MNFVIEQLVNGEWKAVRRSSGMPMDYSHNGIAEAVMANLAKSHKARRYRVTRIKDSPKPTVACPAGSAISEPQGS